MRTRLITFAGNTVAIEYKGAGPTKIVGVLSRHLPDGSHRPFRLPKGGCLLAPHSTYRLLPADGPNQLCLYRDEALLYEGSSEAEAAEQLLGDVCYHLAAQSRDGLLFHAAGLAWQGQGLILPGQTGAGKTTLTAWLMAKGFDYLTDELVFVPHGAETIQTFTRPLNLKNSARSIWQNLFELAGQTTDILSSPHSDLVPPTLFRPANRLSQPPLRLMIFPRYQSGSDFVWHPLSKAQAGLELMQCLINARNLPEHGFPEITRLARRVPAYAMRYSHFEQIGERIEKLLEI